MPLCSDPPYLPPSRPLLLRPPETLCVQVAREVVARHGKALTLEAQRAALGKRPLECWADVVQVPGKGPGGPCE